MGRRRIVDAVQRVERPPGPAEHQIELRHAQLEVAVVEGAAQILAASFMVR